MLLALTDTSTLDICASSGGPCNKYPGWLSSVKDNIGLIEIRVGLKEQDLMDMLMEVKWLELYVAEMEKT
jgi:hypothetical protein